MTAARLGSSQVLVLWGEPGIGKTALLGAAVALARAQDMGVLAARGIESEAEVPFGGLLELLRPGLEDLPRVPPAQAEALRGALDLGPTVERDRFLVGAATLNLLSLRSERAPLLVVVDDAHWIDASSLTAIVFAARRLVVDPVAVLFAARSGEAPALEAARLPALTLAGVDERTAAEIVTRHAPAPPGPGVAERLARATGGNPLALVELAAAGHGPGPVDGPLATPTTVASAYGGRIAALSEPCRRVLALAAAEESGGLSAIEPAARRLGLQLADLAAAERAGLVAIAFGALTWRHPLVRSAAYGAVEAADRRALHAALAETLPEHEPDRRAWHAGAAALEPDETVAAALEAAGRRARARSAYAGAAAAAERAAQLTPDPGARARRLLASAEAAWLGGYADRARRTLEQALALAREPQVRAEVEHLRGQVLIRAGDVLAGHAVLVRAAAGIEATDPDQAIVMLAEATDACVYAGRPHAMLAPAERAAALLRPGSGERARFFANLALGTARISTGRGDEGAGHLRAAVAILEASDVLSEDPRLVTAAALGPLWLREAGMGGALIDRAVDLARTRGALGTLPFALVLAARAAATTDRWAVGRALYEEAIGLARETDQALPLCFALAGLATVHARQGDAGACRTLAQEALALSDRHGFGFLHAWALEALGELELGAGRPDRAVEWLTAKQRTLDDLEVTDPDLWPVPELVEAAVRGAQVDEVDARVAAFARLAEAKGQPWALARLERCRGLRDGADHFEAALRLHAAAGDHFEEARTRLCFGQRLRRDRHRVQAREQLRAALAGFDALGAAPWAEQAHAELLATGERARRRDPSTLDDLTPQELQISLVLAGGATTREAATKLFLSPKTVEHHLRNAYRKLGIHSREDLIRTLGAMPQDQVPP